MFRQRKHNGEVDLHYQYPHRLNMYTRNPDAEITLEQFEQWAIDRMLVLDKLDALQNARNGKEAEKTMRPVLNQLLPLNGRKASEAERRKDHYSHFILRLAFCRSAELRARFVRLETALFKLRFETDDLEDRRAFVNDLGINWDRVSSNEKQQFSSELQAANPSLPADEEYFKVDFWIVPDLLSRRSIFVHHGKAYVPESQQLSLIATEYSRLLDQGLDSTARMLPRLEEDQRLFPVLDHLSSGFGLSNYTADASKIDGKFSAESINSLDKQKHLPLCQAYMHRELVKRHHAHYQTREQYTRFLKHIGMPMEEAQRLWNLLYHKDTEKKQVDYQVRHIYGAAGSHINYKAMSCHEIYKKSLGLDSSQTSGCPFSRLNDTQLSQQLNVWGVSDQNDLDEINKLRGKQLYHQACGKVYEITHPTDKTVYTEPITSPNQYFERSWQFQKKHAA